MLSAPIQFLPLILFSTYAFWPGHPTNERWVKAFTLGAVAAIVQLLVILRQRKPANRLILGANLYLLVGGIAAVAHQWWLLEVYARLNETGIFVSMLIVGVVATIISPAGFIGVDKADINGVRRYSTWLLAATLIATAVSIAFQGSRTWSAVVPLVTLALLYRGFARRLSDASVISK